MAKYRDHEGQIIDQFNGLWDRGDKDSVPLDHFADCENLKFLGSNAFKNRDGVGISQDVEVPLENVKRIYNYPTLTGNTLIVLTYDEDADEGNIYHVVDTDTLFGPILTIEGMTDFAFVPYAGRAYISPFSTFTVTSLQGDTLNIEKGLEDEVLYVYAGDGTAARPAAGAALTGNITIANGAAGHTDAGLHVFGFVAETISGYLTPPGVLETFTTSATFSVSFGSVPTSGDPNVVRRHLVASKVITNYNGDVTGYQLFFVPDGTIDNNTDTFLNNVSFFDQDLLDDASHLLDNYEEIPAGAVLSICYNRLVLATTFDDIQLTLVSAVGEPEAISQIDGLLTVKPDGNPVTNVQELRSVLYLFKRARTVAYVDNGGEPSTWIPDDVDLALGTCVHGIATVLDSGSASVDYLLVATYQGIIQFNGKYISPELTWKVENYWKRLDRNEFRKIQIVNAPIQKWILCVLPTRRILVGDYSNGMDAKRIRWCPWSFKMGVNTIGIANIDEIILGADINA